LKLINLSIILQLNALVDVVKASGPQYLNDDLSSTIDSRITANFAWLDVNRDPLLNWIADTFSENSGPTVTSSISTILVSAMALLLYRLF